MRLSDDFLQELHEKVDIENVISPYVQLKRKGKLLGGLCPFHNEKTPSFYVYPETQSYYCFGCGSGGDAITFVKNIENLDYMEAVKLLCERNGIQMPEDNYDNGLSRRKQRINEANREAARFYYSQLFEPHGKIAREYCAYRQLTKDTITKFGIGYAPDSWTGLKDYLNKKGFSDIELFEADLVKKSQKGSYYDTFRNRLMFPVIDLRGNVIAFSGRRLNEEDRAKYVNSSDTLVYKKGREIFGLNLAKKTKQQNLILCEGNIDVVMLHQAGFDNAVAALGTALTEEQAQVLSRYTSEILLCYDNDEAGHKAVNKALGIFSRTSVNAKVITMTGGKDPDEIIKKYGKERFIALIDGASNDVEYKLSLELHKYDIATADGRVNFVRSAAKILSEINSSIEVDIYATKLSNDLSVNKDAIMREISKNRQSYKRTRQKEKMVEIRQNISNPKDVINRVNASRQNNLHVAKAEEVLIATLINNPIFFKQIKEEISPEDFVTDFNKRVFSIIFERLGENKTIDISYFASVFTQDEISALSQIIASSQIISNSISECRDCIKVIIDEKHRHSGVKPSDMNEEDFLSIFNDDKSENDENKEF